MISLLDVSLFCVLTVYEPLTILFALVKSNRQHLLGKL